MSRLPFEGVSKNSRIKPGHWKFGPKSCLLAGEKFSFSFKADRSEKRECWELYSSDGEVTAIKPGHQESEQATWNRSVEKAPGARPGGLPWSQQELEENSGPCSPVNSLENSESKLLKSSPRTGRPGEIRITQCYGLNCILSEFICWDPNPQYLRMWTYMKVGSLWKYSG